MALIKIFGLKKDEIIGIRRKLHEDFHNSYASPNITRMMKSRMRWAGHVACMRRIGMYTRFWWESETKETTRRT
jgi:hypothetical protein